MKKAQTSIVLILMVLIIFGGLVLFLLSLAQTISQEDYMNIYVHNMILSLLRTDTGELGKECKFVSDAIACATYRGQCDSGTQCKTLVDDRIDFYMEQLNQIKTTYNWYIGVFDRNELTLLEFGDPRLLDKKTKKWSASEIIYEAMGLQESTYIVRLILARKD